MAGPASKVGLQLVTIANFIPLVQTAMYTNTSLISIVHNIIHMYKTRD
jgi:hypothetical protein